MSEGAVRTWLLVQGGAFLSMGALFGVIFPLIGGALALLGVPSPNGDGAAPWITMVIAGPCTSLFYVPGGIASLFARRRLQTDPERALLWVAVAAMLSLVVCPLGIVPVIVVATRRR